MPHPYDHDSRFATGRRPSIRCAIRRPRSKSECRRRINRQSASKSCQIQSVRFIMPYASQSGRSSMVERELPKLYTRVPIPSPAPDKYLLVFTKLMNLQQFSVSAPHRVSTPMSDGYQLATPVMTLSFSPQHNDARSGMYGFHKRCVHHFSVCGQ